MGDVFVTEEAVWVRQESGFLYRIAPANNALIEQIKPDQSLTGGDALVTSDSIWTTANEDDLPSGSVSVTETCGRQRRAHPGRDGDGREKILLSKCR